MTESELNQRLSPIVATTLLLSLFGWLLLGLFALSLSLHALLLTSLGALMVCGRLLGIGIDELRDGLFQGIQDAIPALVIFLMIGVLMASFMLSGTVPSLCITGSTCSAQSGLLPRRSSYAPLCLVPQEPHGVLSPRLVLRSPDWDRSLASRPRSSRAQPSLAQASVTRCRPFRIPPISLPFRPEPISIAIFAV